MAGPRVLVRRGRRAKLPDTSQPHLAYFEAGLWSCTNQLLVGLIEEDGVVGLAGCQLHMFHPDMYLKAPVYSVCHSLTGILTSACLVCSVVFLKLVGGDGAAPLDERGCS